MNKIRLPTPIIPYRNFLIRDLINNYLAIYKDVYINDENIRLETYDSWDFYNVSIFRQSRKFGHGDLEYRNREWEKTKQSIDIFDIKGNIDCSWRWILNEDTSLYDNTNNMEGYIPGISFWVYKLTE